MEPPIIRWKRGAGRVHKTLTIAVLPKTFTKHCCLLSLWALCMYNELTSIQCHLTMASVTFTALYIVARAFFNPKDIPVYRYIPSNVTNEDLSLSFSFISIRQYSEFKLSNENIYASSWECMHSSTFRLLGWDRCLEQLQHWGKDSWHRTKSSNSFFGTKTIVSFHSVAASSAAPT